MSSDLKINQISQRDKASSHNILKNEQGSKRNLLEEFSEILSKITSAVKTATQDSEQSFNEVKKVEIKKKERSNSHSNQSTSENTNHKTETDSYFANRDVNSDYGNKEAEVKQAKNLQTQDNQSEKIETKKDTFDEAGKEIDENSKTDENIEVIKNADNSKIKQEVQGETKTEDAVLVNGEVKDIETSKEATKNIENSKIISSKEDKEKIKEEAFTYQENSKIDKSEVKKEAINNEVTEKKANVIHNQKEDLNNEKIELKTQIKQELFNHIEKKEHKKTPELAELNSNEEKIALKSDLLIEKNSKNLKLDLNVNITNQMPANTKEKMMKSMIEQAKNILAQQFDFSSNTNSNLGLSNQASSNSIQNIQASLSGKNADLASKSKPLALPKTYATRTMHKVEEIIKELSKAKDGKTISVRLDPPSLGSLKVDVSLKEGSLMAKITAESSQVGQFLKDKAVELQQLLRKSGINVDEVNVWLGSQGEFSDTEKRKEFDEFNQEFFQNTNEEFGEVDVASIDSSSTKKVELDHWVA